MSANPHANGGRILKELDLPDFRDYAIDFDRPAVELHESTRQLGKMLRDIYVRNQGDGELPSVLPGRDQLESPRQCLRSRKSLPRRADSGHRRPSGA